MRLLPEEPTPGGGVGGPMPKRLKTPLPTPLLVSSRAVDVSAAERAAAIGEPFLERRGDFAGRLGAVVRLLGHHRFADVDERRRRVGPGLEDRFRPGGLMLQQPLGDRAFRETAGCR